VREDHPPGPEASPLLLESLVIQVILEVPFPEDALRDQQVHVSDVLGQPLVPAGVAREHHLPVRGPDAHHVGLGVRVVEGRERRDREAVERHVALGRQLEVLERVGAILLLPVLEGALEGIDPLLDSRWSHDPQRRRALVLVEVVDQQERDSRAVIAVEVADDDCVELARIDSELL
jgi:hypothetical protein